MSRKTKKLVVIILICLLSLLMILPTIAMIITYANAASSDEIQAEIDVLKEEAAEIDREMAKVQAELDRVAEEVRTTNDEKVSLDQQIELKRREIENTIALMQQYGLLIAEKQAQLDEAIEQEQERRAQFQERIRAMEENSEASYLAMIFQSASFGELLDNIETVADLMNYDQTVMASLAEAQAKIDVARASLEENKTELIASKALLEEQRGELNAQLLEANDVLLTLHEEREAYASELEEIERLEAEVWAEIDDLTVEYEKKKAEEVEAARLAALEAERAKNPHYTYNGDTSFTWPVNCYTITDVYGMRVHPTLGVYKLHTGVDIGATWNQTITAAKSGWVTVSGTSQAYGEYVVISHGNGEVTLYAHMSSRAVSKDDYVVQGSTIGYVGSSGYSTGPHLHFEIRVNGAYQDPLNYFNHKFTYV
ncbi:MAG: peptidoglycan DD-metalloendopeptidase family protein [Oscillospiraceae bacterium]|nr:peptidoglycan DD-metalloendopeptidase family protein [Oscillospiraceae bacterium]